MGNGTRLKNAIVAGMVGTAVAFGAVNTASAAPGARTYAAVEPGAIAAKVFAKTKPLLVLTKAMGGVSFQTDKPWTKEWEELVSRIRSPAPKDAGARRAAEILQKSRTLSGVQQLLYVNNAWNKLPYSSDWSAWGKANYLAEPREFAARGTGDCDDYAIAKAWTLVESGWPADRVFVAVFHEGVGRDGREHKSHAVCCAVAEDGHIHVLDSLHPRLRTLNQTLASCGPPAVLSSLEGMKGVSQYFVPTRPRTDISPGKSTAPKTSVPKSSKAGKPKTGKAKAGKPVASLSQGSLEVPDFLAGAGAQIAQARLAEQGMRLSMDA